ncbi:MAG: class C sortase [Clostridia bacterium]|nr:class C sortase [Clostridia bacterium]
MKSKIYTAALLLIFVIGVSLLLYPTVSDYWNSFTSSRAITHYSDEVANMNRELYQQILGEAQAYNQSLVGRSNSYLLSDAQKAEYERLLNIDGTGVMGYVEVPSIKVSLPIYHGTEESVLQVAIGHLEWSSLPVGGASSHCVISGHRGLPSAKLFSDLDEVVEGDIFIMRVLDETFTYEVDQILIVEPQDTEALLIQEGEDLCTLVTCTPYGINTHRLLVRGHRIDNLAESNTIRITSDAMQIEPIIVAPIVAMPMILILVSMVMFGGKKKPKKK